MKFVFVLPLLIMKSLSSPVNDYTNQLSTKDDMSKVCFVDKSQYKTLDSNLVGSRLLVMALDTYTNIKAAKIDPNKNLQEIDSKKLAMVLKNAKYLHLEFDQNKLCGFKVSKNATSGEFVVEYKSFFKSECSANAAQNVICDNSENNKCDMAVKCCDPSDKCELNSFLLQSVLMSGLQPIANNNGDICSSNNADSCFTIAQLVDDPTKKNSQQQAGGQLNFLLTILSVTILPYLSL